MKIAPYEYSKDSKKINDRSGEGIGEADEALLLMRKVNVEKKIEVKGLGPRWGPVKTAISKTNRRCFASDIVDDEQNI
jgi:hypothetical protein